MERGEMIFYLVLPILATIIVFYVSHSKLKEEAARKKRLNLEPDSKKEIIIVSAILSSLILFIGFVIGGIIAVTVGQSYERVEKRLETTTAITLMKDNSGSSGVFYRGTGSINGTIYYTYYYQDENHSYRPVTINAAIAQVFEEDRADGIVEEYVDVHTVDPVNSWFAFSEGSEWKRNPSYIFRLPKGSVKQEMVIDAE